MTSLTQLPRQAGPVAAAIILGCGVLVYFRQLGSWALRLTQACDARVVQLLRQIARITGALWMPEGTWHRIVRWTWFSSVFGSLFLLSWQGHQIASWLPLAAICAGYFLAIAVGRSWVQEETRLLNGEPGSSAGLSGHLQPMAWLSFAFLLLWIPLSFHETQQTYRWFEASNAGLPSWSLVTVQLLLHAVVDFIEILSPGEGGPQKLATNAWEGSLVLLHFITLAYVVVNGVSLVARGDQAIHADLERLKRDGSPGLLVHLGPRVVEKLVRILNGVEAGVATSGTAGAARVLGEIADQHPRQFPDRAFRALLRAADHQSVEVRDKAVRALARTRNHRAKAKLLHILLHDPQKSIVGAAAMALREFSHPHREDVLGLIRRARSVSHLRTGHLEHSRRTSIAMLFQKCPWWIEPAWAPVSVNEWIVHENDPEIKATLGKALELRSRARRERIVTGNLVQLADATPANRETAARELAPFVRDSRVPAALLHRIDIEDRREVRFELVRSLYREQGPHPRTAHRILPCLRRLLEDPDPAIRAAAAEGLGFFPPPSPRTPGLLLKRLEEDEDLQVQQAALKSLAYLGGVNELAGYVARRRQQFQQEGRQDGEANPDLVDAVQGVLLEMRSGGSMEDPVGPEEHDGSEVDPEPQE